MNTPSLQNVASSLFYNPSYKLYGAYTYADAFPVVVGPEEVDEALLDELKMYYMQTGRAEFEFTDYFVTPLKFNVP